MTCASTLTSETRGSVRLARGRVVHFAVCHYQRPRKRKRYLVRWCEAGKRYRGWHYLPWLRSEAACLDVVRQRWRAVRGGFLYPANTTPRAVRNTDLEGPSE